MSIFITTPITNGHSWTIISKLGKILESAEILYGPRDKSFTILGIECNQLNYPQTWFPGGRKDIIIQITSDCLNDMNRAVYQVAHEAIHCLSPQIGIPASVLEEGLATYFSIHFAQVNGHGNWNVGNPKYENALNLVKELFLIDSDIIKKLRLKQPVISLIDKKLITDTNSQVPIVLAEKLTKAF